jgi:hypothetical protein
MLASTTVRTVAGVQVHITVDEVIDGSDTDGKLKRRGWNGYWSEGSPPAGLFGEAVKGADGKAKVFASPNEASEAAADAAERAIQARCSHGWEKERIVGADTGDVVCTRCGKETWGGNVR